MKTNQEMRKENLINLFDENGKEHGYWESYYENGQLYYKGNYVNGKPHGYWEYYWYNGQLWYKGNYVNGERHGYWEYYYSNGKLCYKGFYDMGNRVEYNPDEPKENIIDGFIYPCILEVSQDKDFIGDTFMMPNKAQVCICKLGDKYVCIESPEEQNDYILETIKKGMEYGGGGGMMLIFWDYARKINN
jgi:hypothetical protein